MNMKPRKRRISQSTQHHENEQQRTRPHKRRRRRKNGLLRKILIGGAVVFGLACFCIVLGAGFLNLKGKKTFQVADVVPGAYTTNI